MWYSNDVSTVRVDQERKLTNFTTYGIMILRKEGKNMGEKTYLDRKREYILRYQKNVYKSINFKLRFKEDHEIIEALEKLPNRSEYIKALIKKDMGL